MKYLLSTCCLLCVSAGIFAQREVRKTHLFSPDSSLQLTFKITNTGISYSLSAAGMVLLQSSPVDLELTNGQRLTVNADKAKLITRNKREIVRVPLPYRHTTIPNEYNELEMRFTRGSIQFRLYNNGMAYRIGLNFNDSVYIRNEIAEFIIDSTAEIWFAQMDKRQDEDRFHTSFEAVYKRQRLSAIADTMLTYCPMTIVLPNGYKLALSDANLKDYPGMFIGKSGNKLKAVFAPYPLKEKMSGGDFPQYVVTERADYIARQKRNAMLPWRAVMVAKKDIELPANDLFYLLGDTSEIKDPSWIKAAKGTDEWITGINLFDIPFVAGINTQTYKYYIDFAVRFGLDQVMLDAGWSDYKNLFAINPALNMEELADYAKSKNIRLMLWTLCSTLDRQLDSALVQFKKWGVTSIMTDFMDRDDQPMVNFYHRVAKACADHQIAVMFHGAFPPKGLNRTWPNVLTHEGVLGSEWNIWSDLTTPEHNVAIAYTRMLAGPLDYEPGLLLNAQKDQFRAVSKNPMSQGTRCHQLSMFVIYDSPLQIFSGNISQAIKEPAFMQLLGSIPATWDETIILQGTIGEFIVTARRKGNDWFIAGMNNQQERDVSLLLDFMKPSNYQMTMCKDGLNANSYGSDYSLTESIVKQTDRVAVNMAKGGGFLIRLKAF